MEAQPSPQNPITNTEHPSDKLDKTRTIYDASSTEIMWKNFLAGLMRGFGSVLVWFFFMIIMVNVFLYFAWPHLKPFVDQYMEVLNSLNSLNQSNSNNSSEIDMDSINNLLQQFQTSQ